MNKELESTVIMSDKEAQYDEKVKHLLSNKKILSHILVKTDEPSAYAILNRAIFYVSRLISSQKERDFTNTNYDDIKKVYSIWIYMNMKECIWNHVHLTNDQLLGTYKWKGKLDLINIVLLGLPKELPEQSSDYELHRLLNTMLSMEITADKKLDIIKNEYDILMDNLC